MRVKSLSHRRHHAPITWVQVTLSGRLDATAVAAWQMRLRTFLRNRQLLNAVVPLRTAAFAPGASATPFELGVVISWLIAQPEVVFLRVDRRAALALAVREIAHG